MCMFIVSYCITKQGTRAAEPEFDFGACIASGCFCSVSRRVGNYKCFMLSFLLDV